MSKPRDVLVALVAASVSCMLGFGLIASGPPPLSTEQTDDLWNSRGCVNDARGEWFRDAKFGAIIHFGVYSDLGGYYDGKGPYDPAEQIIGLGERHAKIPSGEYRAKVAGAFNPAKFDAARWVSLMKLAGQKYVILTTKHHDGFCMFKTATTGYNVVDATPFKRDVVKELADECRKQGLEFCVYYSIGDWCAKDVQNPGFANYGDYMKAQLKELLTNYGEIKLLWFDNWWYVDGQWKNDAEHAKELYTFARSINPNMLVNDRCGSGVKSDDGDYATPENQLKGSLQSRYFEVVMTDTDDDNWGWVKGAKNYRTPAEIIRNLIDSVSKGGNFVLNVGPNAEGEFPPEHVALLEEIGKWMAVNGEAIYARIPAPEVTATPAEGALWYATRSKEGEFIYVHVVQWARDKGPLHFCLKGARIADIQYLDKSLGEFAPEWKAAALPLRPSDFNVAPPEHPDPYATVIKITTRPASGD